MTHHGLCDAIGQQVAHEDIDREPDNRLEIGLSVSERETLVQEITQDAPEEIVGSRRHPVAQVKHIVKHEHDGRAEQSIHDADENESIDSGIAGNVHVRFSLLSGSTGRPA